MIRPNNSLIQGSVFCEVGNNLGLGVGLSKFNAFDEIIAKVHVHLTEQYPNAAGSLYRVVRRNKKMLKLCCHLCNKGFLNISFFSSNSYMSFVVMKAQEMRQLCSFVVSAKSSSFSACITECNLKHSCSFLERDGCQKYNAPTKILKRSCSSVLDNAVLPATNSAKKSCFAKSLTQSVEKEGKIRMSVQQARRILRDSNSDSYSSHIEQFTLVESLLLQLQNVDPLGVYYLKTQPLRYEVSGSSPHAHEFKELVVIPSAALHFYCRSRRMGSLDAAHLTSRFQGSMHAVTVKDGFDEIFQVMFGIFANESNHSWSVVKSILDNHFPGMTHLISDKSKGLQLVKSQYDSHSNNNANDSSVNQPCVFALCSQHALKNAGSVNAESREAVKKFAQAPTSESSQYYADELRQLLPPQSFEYLMNRKSEFCFLNLKEKGLLTNYGCVSNNASESTNSKFMHLRDKGVFDCILAYLEKMNEDCLRRRAAAIKALEDGLHVPQNISHKVKELGVRMKKKVFHYMLLNAF